MEWLPRFRNPFRKTYCFFCGESFYMGDCAICISTFNEDAQTVETRTIVDPPRGISRWFFRFVVSSVNEDAYAAETPCRQCPYCQKLLPYNMDWARNIILPVVGDVQAGKTAFIAAMIRELTIGQPRAMPEIRRFLPLNQEVGKKFDEQFREFFETGVMSDRTSQLKPGDFNDPWIYRLWLRKTSESKVEAINLIIYDASGEDLREADTVKRQLKYLRKNNLRNSGAVIYVADPLTVQSIKLLVDQVYGSPDKNQQNQVKKHGPAYVLQWIANSIRGWSDRNSEPLPIPLAISLAKSDLLSFVNNVSPDAKMLQYPNYREGLDDEDLKEVDKEVRDLLMNCNEQELLYAGSDFSPVSYFVSSATGVPPDPKTGQFPPIAPRRCVDQLLWILWKFSLINTKQEKQRLLAEQKMARLTGL